MQGPEHVVSLYVATCGQNGPGLGSDEKEIILLVYVILDASTGTIVGTKQLLVRPDGTLTKDRTVSTSSDTSNNAASPSLTYADAISNNSSSNNNNNNNNNNNITNNNTKNASAIAIINSSGTGSGNNLNVVSNTNTNATSNNNNNTTLINNNNNTINVNNNVTPNGPLAMANTTPGPTPESIIELTIAEAQAAGKSLTEAIGEFHDYLHSLPLIDIDDIKLITDGQLPLRQCLHREACAKDIDLPPYYNRFSDLRKEYLKYKAGDLSRALVPVKDIKKILQTPAQSPPQSIAEIMKELNIPSTEDGECYIRESRDMVSVIQTLLKAGHKFTANEIVNLVLEPGICSIDDEIDGNCIVRARGLPWQSSDQDIAKFFRGLNVAKGGVALCLSPLGRRNGEALIRFVSQEHRDMALKRHKHHIGNRYIEVYRATGEDFLQVAGGASNEAQAFLSKGAQVIIRMRGLPYDCTAKQVLDFFTTGEKPCQVLDAAEGVLFVKKPDGRSTGDAFVLFANESDAPNALSRHRESIGQRYIELFRSTTAEVQQVLNRSMDPKTYEPNHQQPPLIAQLPTMQLSLLPQHLITSGTTKNCIRLRGLPYEALVEHILHFLDDFAKHIIFQGVHMVINAQGQPSGEAFIQMDSEESARLCAQRKHNYYMMFGKKCRYIEVFQCSGDDMNQVLNGGLQSPVGGPPHHGHHHGAKPASLLSPGASVLGAPFGPYSPYGPPTPLLATATTTAHRAPPLPHGHHGHPATAFYPHPLVYWPYPSPPVSPTTYYSAQPPTPGPHPHHQAMYSLDFLTAVSPGSPYGTAGPMSPPTVAIPPANAAGLILSPNKTQPMTLLTAPPLQVAGAPPAATKFPATPVPVSHAAPIITNGVLHKKATTTTPAATPNKVAVPAKTESPAKELKAPTKVCPTGAEASTKAAGNATQVRLTVTAVAANGPSSSAPSVAPPTIQGPAPAIVANQCVELYIA